MVVFRDRAELSPAPKRPARNAEDLAGLVDSNEICREDFFGQATHRMISFIKQTAPTYYRNSDVSTKKYRKKDERKTASAISLRELRENLRKFWVLCGENDSEAARRLDVAPQQFNEWRKGIHAPSAATRKLLDARLRLILSDRVSESSEQYATPFSAKAQRLIRRFQVLMKREDPKLLDDLARQLDYIEKALGLPPEDDNEKE